MPSSQQADFPLDQVVQNLPRQSNYKTFEVSMNRRYSNGWSASIGGAYTWLDDFPATVASRCRTIHVGRVPLPTMVEALERRGVDRPTAESVAVVSGGRPGLALALMDRPEVSQFRELWLSIPGQVTPHPGDGQRLASEVLAEISPLVARSVSEDMSKEREQRARRRAEQSLLVNGLEVLASWYTDSASLQMGGPVRNSDLPLGEFTEVTPRKAVASAEKILDAVVDIQANLRRELVLANLFASLGSED